MAVGDTTIPWIKILFNELDGELKTDEVDRIKHLLTPKQLNKRDSEHVTNALELFTLLQERGHISEINLDLLGEVFNSIGRQDLRSFVNKSMTESRHTRISGMYAETAKKCKDLLKRHYEEKMTYIDPVPWYEAGFQLPLLDVYTQLELAKRSREGYEYKSVDFRKEFTPSEQNRRILVEGEPGIGKSTFCRKMALDWAMNTEPMLEKFELLILLELRQMVDSTDIVKAIFDQLLPEESGVNETDLRNYIRDNQDKILIVLDGADELKQSLKGEIISLMNKKKLPKSSVIISSRSTEVNTFVKCVNKHFILRGFSKENISEYIMKYVCADRNKALSVNTDEARGITTKINENENIAALAINPLNAVLLCLLWKDNKGELPSKLSDLYAQLVMSILRRHCEKQSLPVPEGNEIPRNYMEEMLKLGEMSYDGLATDKVRFAMLDFKKYGIGTESALFRLGLLTQEYSSARLQPGKYWVFVHKSFQEYMAAYYLVQTNQVNDRQFLRAFIRNSKFTNTCLLVAGLLDKDGDVLFSIFAEVLNDIKYSDCQAFEELSHLALSCLHESGHPELFVLTIASSIIHNNEIRIGYYVSIVSNACTSGLNHVVRYCNQNADTNSELKLRYFRLSTVNVPKQTLAVLAQGQYLESLRMKVPDDSHDELTAVLEANPIKNLGIQIKSKKDMFSVMTFIGNFMSKLNSLDTFKTSLYDTGNQFDITEYRRNTQQYHSLFHLNETLQSLIVHGDRGAEIFFSCIGEHIARHNSLKYLNIRFSTNALLAERRRVLTNILRQNNSIKILHLNLDIQGNFAGVDDARQWFNNRRLRYESELNSDEIETRKQASKEFYESIVHNKSLQFVWIEHCGDDDDLISILSSIKANRSLRVVFIMAELVTKEIVAAICSMLRGSETISILGVTSEVKICATDDIVADQDAFNRIEFTVDVNQDESKNARLTYNEVYNAIYPLCDVIVIESENDSHWDMIKPRLRNELFEKSCPRIQKAGFHLNVWERK